MVQNVVLVVGDAVEQPFVGGPAQFFKRAEIRLCKVAARTAANGRLQALSVGRIGKPPPGGG